ncbi:MAG: DUF4439 domain-containing protein, partial [Blastococcus sp.]
MADDKVPGALDQGTENAALNDALAAEHAAIWGYGVVGAALDGTAHRRRPASTGGTGGARVPPGRGTSGSPPSGLRGWGTMSPTATTPPP